MDERKPVDAFDPKRRRWITLLVIVIVGVTMATIPVIVRHYVRPTPIVNRTARELLPPAVSKSALVTLHCDDEELGAAIAATLPRYDLVVATICPPIGGSLGSPTEPFPARPVEGIVLRDETNFAQIWTQIFGADTRQPDQHGVGRESFFLTHVPSTIAADDVRAVALPAHDFGEAMLEQALRERYRYLPEWYVYIVGEMAAIVVAPAVVDRAWARYAELREEQGEAPTGERDFVRRFSGERRAMNETVATLIAARFLRGEQPSRFVALVDEGEELETAFRAAAVTSRADDSSTTSTSSPTPVGTSFEAVIGEIEADYQRRRDGGDVPVNTDG